MADDIAIGVEHANLGDRDVWKVALPAPLAQEVVYLEHGRLAVGFRAQDRRLVSGHAGGLAVEGISVPCDFLRADML
jgi:hypothetical protein